jgi:hypothetical protein
MARLSQNQKTLTIFVFAGADLSAKKANDSPGSAAILPTFFFVTPK